MNEGDESSASCTIRSAEQITNYELPQPEPNAGQLLVRVKAAGVSRWDALIREGKVILQPLSIVLGSELSGIIEAIGADVSRFKLAKKCTA